MPHQPTFALHGGSLAEGMATIGGVSELGARLVPMTGQLRAGTALVIVVGRGFDEVNAVADRLDGAFPHSGPMRDQITEDAICRTLLLRSSAPIGGASTDALPPPTAFEADRLDERRARVCVAAASADDVRAVMDVVLAGLELVGDAISTTDGGVVFTAAIS